MEQAQTAPHAPERRVPSAAALRRDVLQEVFNLEEGPVTLTFPASLSSESYSDLEAYLNLFLRKAKRQADKAAAQRYSRDQDEE
jgi:hypothetical protein